MFTNLFKIWLILALCHSLFSSRISDACQPGDIGVRNEACFLLNTVLQGKVVPIETGLWWWGVCLFPSRGTVCLSGDRTDCHLAPYVRSRMITPRVKWLHISDDDLVPHCELSPWIAARLVCLFSSGEKPVLFCR